MCALKFLMPIMTSFDKLQLDLILVLSLKIQHGAHTWAEVLKKTFLTFQQNLSVQKVFPFLSAWKKSWKVSWKLSGLSWPKKGFQHFSWKTGRKKMKVLKVLKVFFFSEVSGVHKESAESFAKCSVERKSWNLRNLRKYSKIVLKVLKVPKVPKDLY